MKDLARRYYVATGSNEGRRKLASLVLMIALAINLAAGLLPFTVAYRPLAVTLYSIGSATMVVAILFLYLNRKAA